MSRPQPTAPGHDYLISPQDTIGEGGPKERFNNNVEALRLLKRIEAEGRLATPDEQAQLIQYVGWGDSRFNLAFGKEYRPPRYPQGRDWAEDLSQQRGWGDEYRALREVMTPEEYDSVARSRLNAHYTSREIIEAMWSALEKMGLPELNRIKVLEPAAGVGYFYGYQPAELAAKSSRAAVELDDLSGRITRQLFQNADVRIEGYQKAALPRDYYDLAISNVPFGNYNMVVPEWETDRAKRWLNTVSIHNQFFARALEHVRPGGVIAFITTHYTMDSTGMSGFRNYLHERAELLGAVRLPNTAFQTIAGTEVTTDILFLRRRLPGEALTGEAWVNSVPLTLPKETEWDRKTGRMKAAEVMVNEYFRRHPEMVLGEHSKGGSMYRGGEYTVLPTPGRALGEPLREALGNLPTDVIQPISEDVLEQVAPMSVPPEIDTRVKPGAHFLAEDGLTIMVREAEQIKTATFRNPRTEKPRVRGMIRLWEAAREANRIQLEGKGDEEWKAAVAKLNKVYDEFTSKHGALHRATNWRLVREDPNLAFLLSLEKWNKEQIAAMQETYTSRGVTKTREKRKLTSEDQALLKSAIFTQRTVKPPQRIESADTPKSGLLVSLDETGRVDLERIGELTGMAAERVREELKGLVYDDPQAGLVTADEYLSGNVRRKLALAEEAASRDPKYEENVQALREVLPKDLPPSQIDVFVGAGWVPDEVMTRFAARITGLTPDVAGMHYIQDRAQWTMPDAGRVSDWSGDRALRTAQWGTPDWPAERLLYALANSSEVKVTRTTPDGTKHTDITATLAAQDKAKEIQAEFRRWAWDDPDRSDRLVRLYNDEFNSFVPRAFDGSHLTLPGSNPDIALLPHQSSAVWRILSSGNTLLAHEVGAGKTYVMIAAGMEARRLGLSRKNVYVVPNHLVEQWAAEFMKMYPNATILVPEDRDYPKRNRQVLLNRIATGDWDAVIVPMSQFVKLSPYPQTYAAAAREDVEALTRSILDAGEAGDETTQKELQKAKERLEAEIERTMARLSDRQDIGTYWDELGVDMLFVDESDLYKNLWFASRMERIKGLSRTKSQRAFDMYVKVRDLARRNNGRGVVFATGTPISNTIAELWTTMRYLMRENLDSLGLAHFDAWARTFGNSRTTLEYTVTGNYRNISRFSQFINAPELSNLWQAVADVVMEDDIPEIQALKPKLLTGQRIEVVTPRPEFFDTFFPDLEERIDWVRQNANNREAMKVDNYLKIYGDARKAALDPRLIDPTQEFDPEGKVATAARIAAEIYHEEYERGGTVLVFLDLATPKSSSQVARIKEVLAEKGDTDPYVDTDTGEEKSVINDLYSAIRDRMIERGVKPEHIAYIHDAKNKEQRQQLFERMNSSDLRVLMGSTEKMGAGMNVQKALAALIHVDTPWRPRDIEQREGRILRRGNEAYGPTLDPRGKVVDEGTGVRIYQLLTEGSFDAYVWQTVEAKWRGMKQLVRRNVTERVIGEMDEDIMDAAKMISMAAGNPLAYEVAARRNHLQKLRGEQARWFDRRQMARRMLKEVPGQIAFLERAIEQLERDRDLLSAHRGQPFGMVVNGVAFDKRNEAGAALMLLIENNRAKWARQYDKTGQPVRVPVGRYQGFQIDLVWGRGDVWFQLYNPATPRDAPGSVVHSSTSMIADDATAIGLVQRIGNALPHIASRLSGDKKKLASLRKEFKSWQDVERQPFRNESELARLQAEISLLEAALEEGATEMPDLSAVTLPEVEDGTVAPVDVEHEELTAIDVEPEEALEIDEEGRISVPEDEEGELAAVGAEVEAAPEEAPPTEVEVAEEERPPEELAAAPPEIPPPPGPPAPPAGAELPEEPVGRPMGEEAAPELPEEAGIVPEEFIIGEVQDVLDNRRRIYGEEGLAGTWRNSNPNSAEADAYRVLRNLAQEGEVFGTEEGVVCYESEPGQLWMVNRGTEEAPSIEVQFIPWSEVGEREPLGAEPEEAEVPEVAPGIAPEPSMEQLEPEVREAVEAQGRAPMPIEEETAMEAPEADETEPKALEQPVAREIEALAETIEEAEPPEIQAAAPPAAPPEGPPEGPPPEEPPEAEEPPRYESQWDLVRKSRQPIKVTAKLRDKFLEGLRIAKMEILDRFDPVKAISEETGIDAYTDLTLVGGAVEAAESLLIQNAHPIIKMVGEHYQEFGDYLLAMRMRDWLASFPEATLPGGVTDPQMAIDEMRAQLPEDVMRKIERAAQLFWHVSDALMIEEGLRGHHISAQAADAMRARWPHYVPFYRQGVDPLVDWMEIALESGEADWPRKFSERIKEEGSHLRVKDPIAEWQKAVIREQTWIARNLAKVEMVRALDEAGKRTGTTLIEEEANKRRGWDVVRYRVNGEIKTVTMPIQFATIANDLDAYGVGLITRLLRAMSRPLVYGAVRYNPIWPLVNASRDVATAWWTEGLVPFCKLWWRAVWAALTRSDTWHEAAQAQAFTGTTMREALKRAERPEAVPLGAIEFKTLKDFVMAGPRFLDWLNTSIEQGTKLAVWMKLADMGLMDKERARRAAASTVNFWMGGRTMRMLSQVIPFINARTQGSYTMYDVARRSPWQAVLRSIPILGIALLTYVWNRLFPSYEDVPDYERRRNWIIMLGEGMQEPDPRYPEQAGERFPLYIKVPKPEIVQALTAPVEALLQQAWLNEDRSAVEVLLEATTEGLMEQSPFDPNLSSLTTPVIGTAIQIGLNKDMFRRRDIVPEGEMGRPPEEQYDQETTRVAIALGRLFKVSPRYVDFAIQDVFASGGRFASWLGDLALKALGYNAETPGEARRRAPSGVERVSQMELFRRFIGTRGTEPIRRAYRQLDRITKTARRQLYKNPEVNRFGLGIYPPGNTITVEGVQQEVSPEERARIMEFSLPRLERAWAQLIQEPYYQRMRDDEKYKMLNRVRSKIQDNVRSHVLAGYTGEPVELWTVQEMPDLVTAYGEYMEWQRISGYYGLTPEQEEALNRAQSTISAWRRAAPGLPTAYLRQVYAQQDPMGAYLLQYQSRLQSPERRAYWAAHPLLSRYFGGVSGAELEMLAGLGGYGLGTQAAQTPAEMWARQLAWGATTQATPLQGATTPAEMWARNLMTARR